MNLSAARSNILFLITALIWGFAFVAQRAGMEFVGPFTFNGIRFMLGALSLVPLIFWFNKKQGRQQPVKHALAAGILLGAVLFAGASLQQIGLVYTTAGKAGFITGLYVVFVPVLGLLLRQPAGLHTWLGAVTAAAGLYLLGVKGDFTIDKGDFLVLICSIFWAVHVQLVGIFTKKINPVVLSFVQFLTCAVLSLCIAAATEQWSIQGLSSAALPIAYGGFLSVGVAYTLQVVAQKNANPSHAAIILSMESVFAAVGGWLFLHESLSMRGFIGCALILTGMLLAQIDFSFLHKRVNSLR
jgi:drug/metabolite transporter (DMT)-like permease